MYIPLYSKAKQLAVLLCHNTIVCMHVHHPDIRAFKLKVRLGSHGK